jgi:hypothetical protein
MSGTLTAGAAYADRHSDNDFIFALLLATAFAVWLFTVPAGSLAFRENHGWNKRQPIGKP